VAPRSELADIAWSHHLWQQQVRRGHVPRYSRWPNARTYHTNWPQLAPDLIEADFKVISAQENNHGDSVPYEYLDPPHLTHEPWQLRYADELGSTRWIEWDLGNDNPIGAVMRRARLRPMEENVVRLWLAGDSIDAISSQVRRQKRTVRELLKRAQHKLRETYPVRPALLSSNGQYATSTAGFSGVSVWRDAGSRFVLCGPQLSVRVDEIELPATAYGNTG
jgi:DNA-binding CsgD family transcriptional regulator